ncbi:unnamed protein product, partial [Discosporangium mesarthrocarpum]
WWDHKQRTLEQWLDSNPDEIGVEGATTLIRSQLARGSQNPHLRIKCWKHIVIELSALMEDDTAPSSGTAASLTRRSSMSHTVRVEEFAEDPDDIDLTNLSFVERQEVWLRRKQKSLRAMSFSLEQEAKDIATFNPNVAISRNS